MQFSLRRLLVYFLITLKREVNDNLAFIFKSQTIYKNEIIPCNWGNMTPLFWSLDNNISRKWVYYI